MRNQSKKVIETAQTANFSDFPLILCGNGPKGTKTMQTQTFFFSDWKIFKPELWLVKVGSNLKTKNLWRGLVTKKDTATILRFKLPYYISVGPIGMF